MLYLPVNMKTVRYTWKESLWARETASLAIIHSQMRSRTEVEGIIQMILELQRRKINGDGTRAGGYEILTGFWWI